MKTSTFSIKPIILATFSCLLWGSAFAAIKMGYTAFGIFQGSPMVRILFAGYRFTLAGLLIIAFAMGMKLSFKSLFKSWRALLMIAMTQTFLQYIFFYIGLSNTQSVKSSILTGTGVFFSMLAAHFYYKHDPLTKHKLLGTLVGFSGVVVASISGKTLDFSFTLTGEGFILLATIVSAIASVLVKETTKDLHPVVIAGVQMTLGGILLLIFALQGASPYQMTYTLQGLALIIYLAFLSATAFSIWFYLLSHYQVSAVSVHKFQVPMWGTLFSVVFLGEQVNVINLLALGLVVMGIILVHKKPRQDLSFDFNAKSDRIKEKT